LLVEDQVMFKELLGALIEAENLLEVVAAAHTVREGITACHRHQPDLLLLDLALPDGSGLDVARALAECRPEAQTIIISGQADTFRCPPDLKEHIYSIVDKTRPFAVVRQELIGCLGKLSSGQSSTGCAGDISRLSPREAEVFRLIGRGLSSKEIAAAAFISPQTVATHRKKIAAKLGLRANALFRFATLHALTDTAAGGATA
jgi:DNA-binding NarL/FixJ family response regulator